MHWEPQNIDVTHLIAIFPFLLWSGTGPPICLRYACSYTAKRTLAEVWYWGYNGLDSINAHFTVREGRRYVKSWTNMSFM